MEPAPSVPPPPVARLVSLDALRGFDMLWIVGADAIGGALHRLEGGPWVRGLARQMEHAAWEGFHFYDLIFPLFLFMVGVAIPLSLDRIVAREGMRAALGRIARRTLLLYVLGIFYYGGLATPLAEIRLLGVLQRIALCYAAASLLYLWLRPRGLVATAVALLGGYWALLTFVPVPGFGAGDFAEGRNLANWFDAQFLPLRKWSGTHDPEGILSTLPAIASCLIGVLASLALRRPAARPSHHSLMLGLAGLALLAVGWAWSWQFPVIKNLWTSSYVLVAGGWSLLLMAGFHLTIDVWGWRRWAEPFVWVGSNALLIYLVSNVVDFARLSERFAGGDVARALDAWHPGLGGLGLALTGAALCFLLCGVLYRRKIFVRL